MILRVVSYGGFPGLPEYVVPGERDFSRISVCRCTEHARHHDVFTIAPGITALLPCETNLPDTQMIYHPRTGQFIGLAIKDTTAVVQSESGTILLECPLPALRWPESYSCAQRLALLSDNPLRFGAMLFACQPIGRFGVLHSHRCTIAELHDNNCTVLSDIVRTNQDPAPFHFLCAHEGHLYASALSAQSPYRFDGPESLIELSAGLDPSLKPCPMHSFGPLMLDGKMRLALVLELAPDEVTRHFLLYILDESGKWTSHCKLASLTKEQEVLIALTSHDLLHTVPMQSDRPNLWRALNVSFYVNGGLFAALFDAETASTLCFWQIVL
ncbi:MAG TPA: hypothetical protein PLP17_14160 [Oligoflexia bacterium]|nr:hypothetical protein [Oligoflexia bacterium]